MLEQFMAEWATVRALTALITGVQTVWAEIKTSWPQQAPVCSRLYGSGRTTLDQILVQTVWDIT
jgi:hypothetical protein